MTPYYSEGGITIYHVDCREILPEVSAEAVVTDPPYGVGFAGWDGEVPLWWLDLARACSPMVVFTTAPTTLWDYPRPDWVLCSARPGSTSRSAFGGFNHWTPVLVYGKGAWSPDIHTQPDCVRVVQNRGLDHPCPKSLSLMTWLVRGTTGRVVDPFLGSGTTLEAAKNLGREAIGIEIEERYCEIAAKRLAQGVLFGSEVSA